MKKFISLILSLLMICSLCLSTTVFANSDSVIVDPKDTTADIFAQYVDSLDGLNFDENYFFVAKIEGDTSIKDFVGFKITTTSTDDIKLAVGMVDNDGEATGLPDGTRLDDFYYINEVSVKNNNEYYLPAGYKYGTYNGKDYIGIALQDSAKLTGDVEVKVEMESELGRELLKIDGVTYASILSHDGEVTA